ncbi:MAG TPA: transcription termination/antitermination NusG family protein [Tepidisphaeraceae bacterium]|jgi:transcription antitermination factor NusG|nr:transcription termination/antitermination NusG family protein [Tepidisphaeraceae bacterium]
MGKQVLETFPTAEAGDWFLLHTKSRQEKKLAEDLARIEVAHFLPLVEEIRFYGKRKFTVEEPLFPGYVFVRGTREQAFLADRTKRVARILDVKDQDKIEWELRNLATALSQSVPLQPYPYLQKGVKVEIKSGPMRGLQGLIDDRKGPHRLILAVEMLGRAVSLEVHGAMLQVVD